MFRIFSNYFLLIFSFLWIWFCNFIYSQKFLKKLWNLKITYLHDFWVFSIYFVTQISVLTYIHKNFLKNLWKRNIVFKFVLEWFHGISLLWFSVLYIHGNLLKNLWKQKVLYLHAFLSNFKLFCYSDSSFFIHVLIYLFS